MILDSSPVQKLQARLLSRLDPSLVHSEISSALKSFLVACKVEEKSDGTLANYRDCVRRFILFLEGAGLPTNFSELTPGHVRLYIMSRQEKAQASTINKEYRALHRFFLWCIGEGLADKSPMANIKPPRMPEKEPQPLTREQIAALLLTQMPRHSSFLALRNKAIVLLLTDTGLRLSEMASIKISEFDEKHGQIRIMGKGRKARVVQMCDKTLQALLMYLLARSDNYDNLWVTEERQPLNRDGIRALLRRMFKLAEIKGVKVGAHVFRHTFAMESFLNGAREFDVQNLLGHSTLTMTRRYMKKLNSTHAAQAHKNFSPVDNLKNI